MPGASPPLDLPLYTSVISRAFNIFQVCQYFTIYRQYFLLKFEKNVHEYLIQQSVITLPELLREESLSRCNKLTGIPLPWVGVRKP
jgi:hypothetical protein